MPIDEHSNIRFELSGGGVNAAAQLLSCQLGEPSFHLIDPRRRRGREMHMIAGSAREPGSDLCGFVGGVVIPTATRADSRGIPLARIF